MSYAGMAGMRAALGDVSGLIGALGDGEWATASAAAGWTVKDVVTHFGDLLGILASAIGGTLSTEHRATQRRAHSGEVVVVVGSGRGRPRAAASGPAPPVGGTAGGAGRFHPGAAAPPPVFRCSLTAATRTTPRW